MKLSCFYTILALLMPAVFCAWGQVADSTQLVFPVAKTVPLTARDLETRYPVDFRTTAAPDTSFVYNPLTNRYEYRKMIGDELISTPIALTVEEYYDYVWRQNRGDYYREDYRKDFDSIKGLKKKEKDTFSFLDFKFGLGPAEKIFGPGGVKVSLSGNMELKLGVIRNVIDNPSLTEQQRNHTYFNFDHQIQADTKVSIGDKMNFDLNYNTMATFDFDRQHLKLGYRGKEDEIIKTLEAGNVSMNTTNSLIRGGASLFGLKTELQFGKFTMSAIFSQQESESRTVSQHGSVQTSPFEIRPDQYEENAHYFLGHYFYEHYDEAISRLPFITGGINIDKIEVWITNRRGDYGEARNVAAFADLAEHDSISNRGFVTQTGSLNIPFNNNNDLYSNLQTMYAQARDISQISQTFAGTSAESGRDYEKIENARRLNTSEYKINSQLGYISLNYPLQQDEILAVAYSYIYDGKTYQVGEFSTDSQTGTSGSLYLKLLKGISVSPALSTWRLMMKNVYPITAGNRQLTQEKFRFDIKYMNDTTGIYLNYITEGAIANKVLLSVENLDNLDTRNERHPDGFFDFVEGFTVDSERGKIIFPVKEPFGKYLRTKIGIDSIADKYVFEELYDSTLTVARQMAEKNKFIMAGEYKGGNPIMNYGGNLSARSMTVYANGVRLREGSDYIINDGRVEIVNPAYENTNIQQSYEDNTGMSMQRKTMMGLNLNYAVNPRFNIGATIMNLSEMPLTMKVEPGRESINNTLFGFNVNYASQSQLLTNMLDKIPLLDLTAPSQITLTAEYARLNPGHYQSKYGGNHSYIDDFEAAKNVMDLRQPHPWTLSSTPHMFPNSEKANNTDYGKDRSLLAWYYIDAIFSRSSSLTPVHIKNDKEQRSNHYARAIHNRELFPEQDPNFSESSLLPVLNVAFYPAERGPYNLDAEGMNPDGTLSVPQKRWGGMSRKIESGFVDFEANNIESVEFWLLDPFIYDGTSSGGDMYFNLGEISEDVLKDGKKFFENGLPVDGDSSKVEKTVWGLVPRQQSIVYAFDNAEGARRIQDVGLNGLSTEDEFNYPAYRDYLDELRNKLSPATQSAMMEDQFSPLRDPAGDTYHYFRGSDYDARRLSILERYKHYNGMEGNSADSKDTGENYNSAYRLTPDVEDINQDNTLNETEKYFQYRISIRPQDMVVGRNYIVQKKEVSPQLDNGKTETVTWYQFKVPLSEFEDKVGNINDFKSIRFMRMFLTNFSDSVILRFGTFQFVYGQWRTYSKDLSNPNLPPQGTASISMSTVNYEEHSSKEPVNYILPPGVNRIIDPGQTQLRQQNEQSLALNVSNLSPGDARAIYKSIGLDTRQYRRIQMFTHAERLIDDFSDLQDDDLSIFMRLGSDYKNNYYEYEIPLKLTPPGHYIETTEQQRTVWPDANMLDFQLELLTNLKLERNREKRREGSTVNYYTPYSIYDPARPMNKVTVVGNPSLSDVKVIMLGVRNNSHNARSTEIWFNELRLTEFDEDGGWAGNANMFVGLSDMGSVTLAGRKETAGFGSLDQGIMERNIDDSHQYSIATQVDLGRFFPEKTKVSIPLYYSYSKNIVSPKYNPLDQDVLLNDALNNAETKAEKDSIRSFAVDRETSRAIGLNNVKVDIQSKKPMPYDPANFSFGFSSLYNQAQNASTQYETTTEENLTVDYTYSSPLKPWKPFVKNNKNTGGTPPAQQQKKGKPVLKPLLDGIEIGFLPSSLQINSEIYRNYFEMQLRDIGSTGGEYIIPVSHREDFYWNRSLETQWKLTQNLNFTFSSGTNARIEAPSVQVNRMFNPDEYELWKESVMQSIRDLGSPMEYKQNFTATYDLPINKLPIIDFISKSVLSYTASYDWNRGATPEDETLNFGNVITGIRNLGIDGNFDLMKLYNKSKFLETANKKYTAKRSSNQGNQRSKNKNQTNSAAKEKKPARKKFESTVALNTDSAVQVNHKLGTKRLRITARNANGKLYPVSYKKIDDNTVEIKNRDSVTLKITVAELPPRDETQLYKIMQGTARGLMFVRSAGVSYKESAELMLPGFDPEAGDFFGQGPGMAPGLDFAFGLFDEGYINRADSRQWLAKNRENITPSMYNRMKTFNFTAKLEPVTGMNITLTAIHSKTDRSETYFMYGGMPKKFSGNFEMTTVSLTSILESQNAENGYYSKTFEKFINSRAIIASRLEREYEGTVYPSTGFLEGSHLAGQQYDRNVGAVDANSTDVLIPAFIAAYTGQNPHSVKMSPFPSLKKMLPNWKITYDGLMQIPLINRQFKTFNIEHAYTGRYKIGSFNSYLNWVAAGSDGTVGFTENTLNGDPYPSSAWDITQISIIEDFNPLAGLRTVLQNDITLNVLYSTGSTVNLNVAAYQIVESKSKKLTLETGYRISNFNRVIKVRDTGGANFNNELNAKFGIAYAMSSNLIRKIENNFTQATNGNSNITFNFTADYSLSRLVTLRAFFDRQVNRPMVSANAYPVANSNFGASIKISLQR
ncbi:MAG: cell surface protein SprA [Dysgonamonadaceae bacterium]|nr:cell surface protein SprA [Dysgonamonadaceae bacterium]